MFDGLLKTKFFAKCKKSIKIIKTRLDIIKKKRNAMEKYLKNDLVDLLKNGLYVNAYGRAEGFLVEQNLSGCYDLIEQFCLHISSHLDAMDKQRDCPEDCREAVSSLMFAAARFADLPELRELRRVFNEKYGSGLDIYVNKQFVEKLKQSPPTKDMKLQLLQKTAEECGIEWNLKAVEQKLYKPAPSETGQHNHVKDNQHRSMEDSMTAANDSDLREHNNRKKPIREEELLQLQDTSSKDIHTSSAKQNDEKSKPDSGKSVPEENDDNKPFYYRFINPPYSRAKSNISKTESNLEIPPDNASLGKPGPLELDGHLDGENGSVGKAKPERRSVRRNRGLETVCSTEEDGRGELGAFEMKQKDDDQMDEEERMLDNLLMHYSRKKSPHEVSKADPHPMLHPARQAAALNPPLKPPPAMQAAALASDVAQLRDKRALSLPSESSPPKPTRGHNRATSCEPDANPKLPDYDEFMNRLKALRGN